MLGVYCRRFFRPPAISIDALHTTIRGWEIDNISVNGISNTPFPVLVERQDRV